MSGKHAGLGRRLLTSEPPTCCYLNVAVKDNFVCTSRLGTAAGCLELPVLLPLSESDVREASFLDLL